MPALRSVLLAAAGACIASNVLAHPRGAHHVHRAHHEKRQEELQLSYVTFYQTQAAGPDGTAVVYTMSSPVWLSAGAAATGAPVPVMTLVPTPVEDSAAADYAPSPVDPIAPEVPVSSSITPSTSFAASASPLPAPSPEASPNSPASYGPGPSSGSGSASGAHIDYSGKPADYPNDSEWLSFEDMFEKHKGDASKGMVSYGFTTKQISSLADGIKSAAGTSGVDARIVLALAMQESHGEATTSGGGIIQATGLNGQPCDGNWGNITEQLECGLKGVWTDCKEEFPDNYPWITARCYNSGAKGTDPSNLRYLLAGVGTPSYVDDLASRLVNGWTN